MTAIDATERPTRSHRIQSTPIPMKKSCKRPAKFTKALQNQDKAGVKMAL